MQAIASSHLIRVIRSKCDGAYLRRCTELALSALLVWGLLSLVTPYFRANHTETAYIAPAAPVLARGRAEAAVADMHIFGAAPNQTVQASSVMKSDISVIGILAADAEKDSVALLSVDGSAKNYVVGQTLDDGETVAHIEPDAVVLEKGTESRRLELDIKFADSNAVFHKASVDDDEKVSWADAYTDGVPSSSMPKPASKGIVNVPSAINAQAKVFSLKEIRQNRQSHFASFRTKAGTPPSAPAAPPH
jgi:type II secretory pathway component PulC